MRSLLKIIVGVSFITFFGVLYSSEAESQAPTAAGCYICGSIDGYPPYSCYGSQDSGMSLCRTPCNGTVYNCAIV